MKTVIGLFEAKDEAMRAYAQLLAEGYARANLDILTNDEPDDELTLARMHSWVPTPDVDIYLAGVRDGGTIVMASVGDTAVARATSILGSFNLVNVSRWASHLAAKVAPTAATGTGRGAAAALGATATAATNRRRTASASTSAVPKPSPVIDEDVASGKQHVERGPMRIYKVVTEREETKNGSLNDETIRVQRRPVSRDVAIAPDVFKPRSFETVEMDQIAQIRKTTRPFEAYTDDFTTFFTEHLGNSGVTFESLAPTFRFGHDLATREPFRSSPWSAVEAYARRVWEEKNPGTWEESKAVVKYAWDRVRDAW